MLAFTLPSLEVQVYELAPKPVNVVTLPEHTTVADDAVTVRLLTTLMVAVIESLQPLVLEPATVYVVVTVGLPVTVAPLVPLKPGLQV